MEAIYNGGEEENEAKFSSKACLKIFGYYAYAVRFSKYSVKIESPLRRGELTKFRMGEGGSRRNESLSGLVPNRRAKPKKRENRDT